MPRNRPAPEINIIQSPDILRRLHTGLGMRQAHIAPALNDGLQGVVIVEDLSSRETQTFNPRYTGGFDQGLQAVADTSMAAGAIINPGLDHQVFVGGVAQIPSTARLKIFRVSVSCQQDAPSTSARTHIGWFHTRDNVNLYNLASPLGQVSNFEVEKTQAGGPNGVQARLARLSSITPVMAPDNIIRSQFHALIKADTVHIWDFSRRPLIIDPNAGIMVYSEEISSTTGITAEMWVNFEWEEEPLKR